MQIEFLRKLIDAGLCPLPIADSESKRPTTKWEHLLHAMPMEEEMIEWKGNAMGIVCGTVSGNLEVIDFDEKHRSGIFEEWKKLLANDPLLSKLTITKTVHNGFHALYRCAEIGGNTKLARNIKKEVLIETRGIGGYVLEPPSSGYELLQRDLFSIPIISFAERAALLNSAKALNEDVENGAYPVILSNASGNRPGDIFMRETPWREILEPHGWRIAGKQ